MINKKNHVFLITESKFSNADILIKNICKEFLSDVDNKDYFLNKIDNNNYYDYREFNLYLNEIKLEDISNLKKDFFSISLESAGYKFYIIKNVNLLTNRISNALLKFIEEPPSQTIGIFTTRNSNKVLPTIYSRCEEIKSKPNLNDVKEYLNKKDQKDLDEFYLNSFYSLDEIILFDKCKNKEIIIDLFRSLKNNKYNPVKILKSLEEFKKLSYKEIYILINSLTIKNKIENQKGLLKLSSNLKYNLNKILIFNEILYLI